MDLVKPLDNRHNLPVRPGDTLDTPIGRVTINDVAPRSGRVYVRHAGHYRGYSPSELGLAFR